MKSKHATLIASGDLRLSANRVCWPEQEKMEAALGKAHARGVVHRDMKPENVLFTTAGRPLIADLGLAKHFRFDVPGASRSISVSKLDQGRGTVGYMPLELGNFVLNLEFSALDFSKLRISCGRMGRRFDELFFQSAMFRGEFCKVIFKAHSNLQRVGNLRTTHSQDCNTMMT